jgi:Type IV secretion system pilin
MSFITLLAEVTFNAPLPKTNPNILSVVLNTALGVLGGISFIIVTWAGLKYVLSQGDPTKTAEARNQILYAGIGLGVAVAAGSVLALVRRYIL